MNLYIPGNKYAGNEGRSWRRQRLGLVGSKVDSGCRHFIFLQSESLYGIFISGIKPRATEYCDPA
jgi:hypothetical protein